MTRSLITIRSTIRWVRNTLRTTTANVSEPFILRVIKRKPRSTILPDFLSTRLRLLLGSFEQYSEEVWPTSDPFPPSLEYTLYDLPSVDLDLKDIVPLRNYQYPNLTDRNAWPGPSNIRTGPQNNRLESFGPTRPGLREDTIGNNTLLEDRERNGIQPVSSSDINESTAGCFRAVFRALERDLVYFGKRIRVLLLPRHIDLI
ncbi:hypothetical protein PG994_003305 [Apiospora phragmitis]|uniref:Uncharacterized protein n=1 Tax=Apiospora phragmitis TaxID=2905665 RepID=A0ABR1VXQ8_9PEZI